MKLLELLLEEFEATLTETYYVTEEEQTASGFDINAFKALRDKKAKIAYAKQRLDKLGAGSSRVVFALSPTRAIKIAKSEKGAAQNETEAGASNIGYDCIAQVFDYDENDYTWLEMERAAKVKSASWLAATKMTFKQFKDLMNIDHQQRYGMHVSVTPEQEELKESEWYRCVRSLLADFDMPAGDLIRPSSWGIVVRASGPEAVLIDYGLTNDIGKKYYWKE
jgi:hypothetical protein